MRCGCPECGAYMVHAESARLGCVCPQCGRRCADCLGPDTLLTREQLRDLKRDPSSLQGFFAFDAQLPEDIADARAQEEPGRER